MGTNTRFEALFRFLAPKQFDISSKLKQFMNKLLQCECPDDVVAVVGTNLASLDAENMVLWEEYMKAATVMLCDLDTNVEIIAPNYALNTHLFTLQHEMMVNSFAPNLYSGAKQRQNISERRYKKPKSKKIWI